MDHTDSPHYHYHIRWFGNSGLDWERFGSSAEAEARAKELVRSGEIYVVEEYDGACQRCRALLKLKHDHGTREVIEMPKADAKPYSWQQPVSDALTESRSEFFAGKINAAEGAISARLCNPTPLQLDERLALKEALLQLRALVSEDTKPEEKPRKATA